MRLALHHRLVALLVLGSLFLWNAPAMAFPALLQQLGQCEVAPAQAPAAAPAATHPMHHHGMMMPGMAMPAAPLERASMAQCFSEHTCCTWNREPAKKNDRFSLTDAQTTSAGWDSTSSPARQPFAASFITSRFVKPVFEKKADLRI